MSGVKRILTALRLDKIAGVDEPCQEGARAVILKRAEPGASPPPQPGGARPKKLVVQHAPGGKPTLGHAPQPGAAQPVKPVDPGDSSDPFAGQGAAIRPECAAALARNGLVDSPDESATDKAAPPSDTDLQAAGASDTQCQAYAQAVAALEQSLLSILGDDGVSDKSGLIDESLQQFAQHLGEILPGDLGAALADGLTPSNSDDAADSVSPREQGEDDQPDPAPLEKTRVPADREAEANRAAVEQWIRTGDAFRSIDGQVITKRRAGDLYAMLKGQDDQLRAAADALAKAHDRERAAEFAKRATDIGCEPEFGATLRKAYAGDPAAANDVENRIRALTAQVTTGELFTSFGHNQPAEGSATAEFMLKVDEVRKSHPQLSDQQAYARAYDNRANAEIVKRMRAESAG